jgi:deoxycytidine triphosphate deaminase
MSVLSNVDLEKELVSGRNIRIYPLDLSNIKGSTYNLTASNYAWSLKTKKSIVENDKIIIPPNDSGLIATQEVIWVSSKICGSYHSKVSIVSSGGGHIGTTLDPEWIGHSLITVHNHSDKDLVIGVNKTFVSIMFHYLNKSSTAEQDNSSSQLDYLYKIIPDFKDGDYFDESWKKQPNNLLSKMKTDPQHEILVKRKKTFLNSKTSYLFLSVTVLLLLALIAQQFLDQNNFIYKLASFITDVGAEGIIVTGLVILYNKLK